MLLGDIGQRQFEVVLGGSACMRSRLGPVVSLRDVGFEMEGIGLRW